LILFLLDREIKIEQSLLAVKKSEQRLISEELALER
jgi:hypothetical protein